MQGLCSLNQCLHSMNVCIGKHHVSLSYKSNAAPVGCDSVIEPPCAAGLYGVMISQYSMSLAKDLLTSRLYLVPSHWIYITCRYSGRIKRLQTLTLDYGCYIIMQHLTILHDVLFMLFTNIWNWIMVGSFMQHWLNFRGMLLINESAHTTDFTHDTCNIHVLLCIVSCNQKYIVNSIMWPSKTIIMFPVQILSKEEGETSLFFITNWC